MKTLQVFGIILIVWIAFFYATGLLTAGLHPDIDPYASLGIDVYYQNGKNFLQDLEKIFNNVLFNKSGFGLWGYIIFAFFAKFFGANMIGIRAFFMLLGTSSFFMLYLTAIHMGWSRRTALLFPSVLMFGTQFWIWYNMCGEPVGVFFTSLTFLCLTIAANRNSIKWLVLSFLSIIATTLSKESFILLLPAFVLFYVWRLNTIHASWTWQQLIVKSLPLAIPTTLIFLAEIAYIILYLGASARGVGVSVKTSVSTYIRVFLDFFATNELYIYLFSGIFLLLNFLQKDTIFSYLKNKNFLILSLFLVAILLPQVILHAQSGWVTRYLFPALFASAFVLALMLNALQDNIKLYNFYTLMLLMSIGAEMLPKISDNPEQAFRQLRNYVSTCEATEGVIQSVVSQSNKQDKLLLVSNPIERYVWAPDFRSIFHSLYGKQDIHILPVFPPYEYDETAQQRINAMMSLNASFAQTDKSQIHDIVIMPFIERLFIKEHQSWFNPNDYERYTFWRLVHYRKKNR